jgi:hypothetical protein
MEKITKISIIRSKIREFALNSTFMGVPNIARNELKLLKIMWLVFVLLASGGCFYICILTVMNYLEYNVVTQIQVVRDRVTEFPTITICNANSLVSESAVNYSQTLIHQITQKENSNDSSLVFASPDSYRFAITSGLMSENVSKILRESLSPSFDQILIECNYGDPITKCNSSYFEPFFDGYFGNSLFIFHA